MAAKFVTKKDNPFQAIFRSLTDTFSSLDKFTKLFIIVAIIVLVVTPTIVNNKQIFKQNASTGYDLKTYYPNTNMFNKYYLEGKNYANPASPTRSVLWFEQQDQWTFKMYNSGPEDKTYARCNYDQLSWWDDGTLRYVKTHNECPGSTPNEIVYDAPIIFLPRYWDPAKGNWSFSGSSNVTYSENGVVKCTGIDNYTAKILGIEQIAPGVQGIHWQSSSKTLWATGSVVGKCAAGYTTNWLEDYWLYANLPIIGGGTAPALKRSKGGNTDITSGNWDVWFDSWKLLPWVPIPTSTPVVSPTLTPKPVDITPPKVTITSPLNGTMVPKNTAITLKATASDNVAVSKVEFYIRSNTVSNTVLLCTVTQAPYNCNWTTPNLTSLYTITAKAYDTSNNVANAIIYLSVR